MGPVSLVVFGKVNICQLRKMKGPGKNAQLDLKTILLPAWLAENLGVFQRFPVVSEPF